MKIYGRVYNRCLSFFMVKMSDYNSPRTNQEPLKSTLVFEEIRPGQ